MSKHFKQRLILGSIGIIALTLAIYFSYVPFFSPIFILLNIAIINLAIGEYYHLAQQKNLQPLTTLGLTASGAYIMAVFAKVQSPVFNFLPSFVLLSSLMLFFFAFFKRQTDIVNNLAITSFGLIYLAIPLSCAIKINYFNEDGRLWLAYVISVTKMTDVGAYFIGKVWGRTKLAPLISPKKTIEGAVGGLVTAMLVSFLFYIYSIIPITVWQSLWVGLVLSLVAQFGDLAESVLKRDAGVKDSSSHLPGLGGVLDIVDSLVFTLPFIYLMLKVNLLG